jgi:hypothetical protein
VYDVPKVLEALPQQALDKDTYLHKVMDGEDTATVTCRVRGSSEFTFEGSIALGGQAFHVADGTVGDDKQGRARISLLNTQAISGWLTSAAASCVIQVWQIQPGAVWASFSCPYVAGPPSDSCRATGTFVMEGCEQE